MSNSRHAIAATFGLAALVAGLLAADEPRPPQRLLKVDPAHISSDKVVKYDYDIVYVPAPRTVKTDGKDRVAPVWPNASEPENLRAPTDLMLLHPNGTEEVLVEGGTGASADPYVSFDAQLLYDSYFHNANGRGGPDVYKVNVKTRKATRLTQQTRTPNTGATGAKPAMSADHVYNMHPCPLPGGPVAFVSNRDGLKAPRLAGGALQLFVMDDDGANVEKIGHLNVGPALHPVVLKDGRIVFSSLEVQGKHNTGRGILGIHPDGTNWDPVVSKLSLGGAPIPFHFQTQLSDESIVVENYYPPAMGEFGVYFKQPARSPSGTPARGYAVIQVRKGRPRPANDDDAPPVPNAVAGPTRPGEHKPQVDEFSPWLAEQFNRNRGWDALAKELVGATGDVKDRSETTFLMSHAESAQPKPDLIAGAVGRVFLGVQLQCAECHDRPFAPWKQDDFWGVAAFFGKLRNTGTKGPNSLGNASKFCAVAFSSRTGLPPCAR